VLFFLSLSHFCASFRYLLFIVYCLAYAASLSSSFAFLVLISFSSFSSFALLAPIRTNGWERPQKEVEEKSDKDRF
jgi:hypothetical protein